ncbi:MAG: helicase C-terminal domain-containing protein [Marmoricola sp.]
MAPHGEGVTLIDGTTAASGGTGSSPARTTAACAPCATAGSATATAGRSRTYDPTAPSSYAGLGPPRSGAVVLPPTYVAEHVDLGYAITAHRAQGVTVDTAHVVVTESTTRENLYVAMTRGRDRNHAYVITGDPDDNHGTPDGQDVPTAREVLTGVLANVGAELSATQTIKTEQETWGAIPQLAAE